MNLKPLKLIDIGGPWKVLEPGIHNVTLQIVESMFAKTEHRHNLLSGFVAGAQSLFQAGCKSVYLDGSFVTEKHVPGDFDACWDTTGVDINRLDPVLLDFSDMRKKQKERFGGEFFPADIFADGSKLFLDFFQTDRYTGRSKGIICINVPRS